MCTIHKDVHTLYGYAVHHCSLTLFHLICFLDLPVFLEYIKKKQSKMNTLKQAHQLYVINSSIVR